MWSATRAAFKVLTVPLEGDIPHMYRDSLGFVTWGIGLKEDPLSNRGRDAGWTKGNGYPASDAEIDAEWRRIKAAPKGAPAARNIATMHVPQPGRDDAFWDEVTGMERTLGNQFVEWEDWPADAQLAVLSMSWNFGPNLRKSWPDLSTHLDDQDFEWAAQHCEPAVGPSARSRGNKVLFYQAARARQWGEPAAVLYGPNAVLSASKLAAAANSPAVRSATGWWVQACLQDAGLYLLALDGQFGPRSALAWTQFLRNERLPVGYTVDNLFDLSQATLRVTVTS